MITPGFLKFPHERHPSRSCSLLECVSHVQTSTVECPRRTRLVRAAITFTPLTQHTLCGLGRDLHPNRPCRATINHKTVVQPYTPCGYENTPFTRVKYRRFLDVSIWWCSTWSQSPRPASLSYTESRTRRPSSVDKKACLVTSLTTTRITPSLSFCSYQAQIGYPESCRPTCHKSRIQSDETSADSAENPSRQ